MPNGLRISVQVSFTTFLGHRIGADTFEIVIHASPILYSDICTLNSACIPIEEDSICRSRFEAPFFFPPSMHLTRTRFPKVGHDFGSASSQRAALFTYADCRHAQNHNISGNSAWSKDDVALSLMIPIKRSEVHSLADHDLDLKSAQPFVF